MFSHSTFLLSKAKNISLLDKQVYNPAMADTSPNTTIRSLESIERRIFLIRGQKIMLDRDIAVFYNVETRALNQAVKRNAKRFPADFIFQLTIREVDALVSQNVIPSRQVLGGSLPYAFTEHGVAMLSAVLKSSRAVEISVFIVRAFIKLREMIATHKDLALKMEKLEHEQDKQGQQLAIVCRIIKNLLDEPVPPKEPIGFKLR